MSNFVVFPQIITIQCLKLCSLIRFLEGELWEPKKVHLAKLPFQTSWNYLDGTVLPHQQKPHCMEWE